MIRRGIAAAATLTLLAAILVYAVVRMPLLPLVGDDAMTRALAYVRAIAEGIPPPTLLAADADQQDLPVIVSVYDQGLVLARAEGRGATFGTALAQAATALRLTRPLRHDGSQRVQIDRVVGRGFLSSTILPLVALGTVPTRDGVTGRGGGREVFLTVDDLLAADVWAAYRPMPGGDFSLGMDAQKTLRMVDRALEGAKREAVSRFRAESAVEGSARGDAHPTRANVEAGARAAAAYLVRHLNDDGRFEYEYYTSGQGTLGDDYSLARHAGSASYLAQSIAIDHDPSILAAAVRAIDYLASQRPRPCNARGVCIAQPQATVVDLGTSALSLVAALEFERTTGDPRYREFATGLVEFLLAMQRDDGEFCHLYDCRAGARDEKTSMMFFSGEAAYALALFAGRARGELAQRAGRAADRALHYLTVRAYDHFFGQFFIGEEHWTCIALDAAWDGLPPQSRERYATFCDEFARFSRRVQFLPGESIVAAQPQLEGSYGVGAQVAANATPVGSRSEALVAIERLARRRGFAATDPRVREPHEQLLTGLAFLLRQQIGRGAGPLIADPVAARGGIMLSDVERRVRIDTVQHAGSAMLGSLSLL